MPTKTWEQMLRDAAAALSRGQVVLARRVVDQALDHSDYPALARAELLMLRGMIRSDQHEHAGARRDLRTAVQLYDDHGAGQSLKQARTLGLLAEKLMGHFDDPEVARPLFERELAILDANLTSVLRDPELRQEWVLATINLAMTYDFLEKYDMARRLYREAEAKCERARLPQTHGLRAVIATGRARLPALAG